jgi:hypothetical protein
MFAEEINDKNDFKNDENINIFINILKEIFPEYNKFFTENNSINIPEIINSDLFNEIKINEKFKKIIKTTVNYKFLQENNEDNEDNTNILQAIKNDITILIPEIKKYSKKNTKNKTINKVVDILDRDNELTRTKNLNTLFTDYNTNEKTLEELLIDLVKQNTTKSNNKNLKETLYNIYDKLLLYGSKNAIILRLIPHIRNIFYLEYINKRKILDIYDSISDTHKGKYDTLLLDKLITIVNITTKSIKTKNYTSFDIINKVKNHNISSKTIADYLINNCNNLLNNNVENSNIIIIFSDYMLNSIRKKKTYDPFQGLTFSLLLSFMEIKTFTRFIYSIQSDLNKESINPLFNTLIKELKINDNPEEVLYGGKIRKRLDRQYDFPIRKRIIKNLVLDIKKNHTLNKHLLLIEKFTLTNISTKAILRNYT